MSISKWLRLYTFSRIVFVLTVVLSFFSVWELHPVNAACTIQGIAYVDFNNNGVRDALEPGQANIAVTAYDETGAVDDTTVTASDGSYTLNPAAAAVRIEFGTIPTYLRSGPAGPQSDTTVTFVNCTGAVTGIDFGMVSPGQYCHTIDPELGIGCYVIGDQFAGAIATTPTVVSFPYNAGAANGQLVASYDNPAHPTLATAPNVGTTFGIAYQRTTDSFFVSSYVKRHTGLGPNATGSTTPTTGGIYQIDQRTNTVTTFVDLEPTFNTGADPHTLPWNRDVGAFDAVGKVGLGDLDISADDTTLYTVNLNLRSLISIPIANPAGATSVAIPDPGCTLGEFRPFGLAVYHGNVYVGIVCDASGVGATAADLSAIVLEYNPTAGTFTQVLAFPLDYPRGCADRAPGCGAANFAEWRPWIATWPVGLPGAFLTYPEPMLTDIDFDSNGDMLLAFRDRWGDQTGADQLSTNLADNNLYNGITAGDILRACVNVVGGWTLENNGSCGSVTTLGSIGNSVGEGPGNPGGEYYFTDNLTPDNTANPPNAILLHDEITIGGVLQLAGAPDVAVVAFDPIPIRNQLFDAGVIWMNNQNGTRTRSYRIVDSAYPPNGSLFFGKANGLGSLEAACGPIPLEIGNRVWVDENDNGQQDPGEAPIRGVIVSLYDASGVLIGKTTTNAAGEYIFNANIFRQGDTRTFFDINGDGQADAASREPRGILPNTQYSIRLDDPRNYRPGGALANYYAASANTVADERDSDGIVTDVTALASLTNIPVIDLTTGNFGDNDHTFDFGFIPGPPLPQTPTPPPGPPGYNSTAGFTLTKSVDNPFAAPGVIVTWTLTIHNPNAQPATNVVVTDNVPSQLEIVPPVTTTSTSGSVKVSGQTVTFNQGILSPNETVQVFIKTRVRSSNTPPFIIVNEGNGICCQGFSVPSAQAQIVSARHLPATGDSWLSQLREPLLLVSVMFVILLLIRWFVGRKRSESG
jgi:uncharacterized repeat protein (TIGR01451 family)